MSGRLERKPWSSVPVASLPIGIAPYGHDKLGRRKSRPYDRHGSRNPRWKGGRRYFQGYYMVYVVNHPYACKNYILEHRHIMERQLGRYLKPHEVVHHCNGKKHDNRLSNLALTNHRQHASDHHRANFYNPPRFSRTMAQQIAHLYWSNPYLRRRPWNGNRLRVTDLAKRFQCARTTILDVIHQQSPYTPERLAGHAQRRHTHSHPDRHTGSQTAGVLKYAWH